MKNQISITSIKIKIGSKEVELTLDEAKQLKKELNSIFAEKEDRLGKFLEEFGKLPPLKEKEYIPWPIAPINPIPPESPWVSPGVPYRPIEIWCSVEGGQAKLS